MTSNIPNFVLNNGIRIPSVGMGCWMGEPGGGERAEKMVKLALKHGYRHFDTAYGYHNEEHVGRALRESGIPREELYVTTKLVQKHHGAVQDAFDISLNNLGIDYVDLYLVHWPQAANEKDEVLPPEESPTISETWSQMEKLLETGKVKSIGVSNFSVKNLEILLSKAKVVPALNQVELHISWPQFELKRYCEEKGILLSAYSPLGRPIPGGKVSNPFWNDETILGIAERNNTTVGQVLISWNVQRGIVTIPKSETEERIKQNIELVQIPDSDIALLDDFHKKPGMHRSLLSYHLIRPGYAVGWTYEQMGWNMKEGGIVI